MCILEGKKPSCWYQNPSQKIANEHLVISEPLLSSKSVFHNLEDPYKKLQKEWIKNAHSLVWILCYKYPFLWSLFPYLQRNICWFYEFRFSKKDPYISIQIILLLYNVQWSMQRKTKHFPLNTSTTMSCHAVFWMRLIMCLATGNEVMICGCDGLSVPSKAKVEIESSV